MRIYPSDSIVKITQPSSDVFKFVENEFHKWIEGTNPIHEYNERYCPAQGDLDKKGAIIDAIEHIHDEAKADKKPMSISAYDLAEFFE